MLIELIPNSSLTNLVRVEISAHAYSISMREFSSRTRRFLKERLERLEDLRMNELNSPTTDPSEYILSVNPIYDKLGLETSF